MRFKSLALAGVMLAVMGATAQAQAPVKLGIVTTLSTPGGYLGEDVRDAILLAIEEETRRLARFVSNLLDMTRLESGVSDLKRDWVDVAEVLPVGVRVVDAAIAPQLRRHGGTAEVR